MEGEPRSQRPLTAEAQKTEATAPERPAPEASLEPAQTPSAGTKRERQRSLLPPEHGAYPQLILPVLSALLWRAPTLPALAFTAAASLAFFLQEPLRILLGARGARRAREDGDRAKRAAIQLGVALSITAALGFALSWRQSWPWALLSGALALAAFALAYFKKDRSLPGELLAAATFAAAGLPAAAAAGVSPARLWLSWVVWWLSFALSTAVVHAILSAGRRRRKLAATPVWIALGASFCVALFGTQLGAPGLVALLPAVLLPAVLLDQPPASTKALGLWLSAAQALTLICLRAWA